MCAFPAPSRCFPFASLRYRFICLVASLDDDEVAEVFAAAERISVEGHLRRAATKQAQAQRNATEKEKAEAQRVPRHRGRCAMSGPPLGQRDPVVSAVVILQRLDDEDILEAIARLQGLLRRRREGLAANQQAKAAAQRQRRSALRVIEGGAK
jgi:ribosomal protein L12E/L44/L45/RPP1/RPP2